MKDSTWTWTAKKLLRDLGYQEARVKAAKSRDMNSWGTASYSFGNAVCKEIEQLYAEQPEEYQP